jgi:hypothetical protein
MKKILVIMVVLLSACTKIVNPPIPSIDLGKAARSTSIKRVMPIVSNGNITVELGVTQGAKYSLQITDLLDEEIKTFGFTADDTIYIKKLDLTSLKNGDYNLILIDIAGKEVRSNIIIKK